MSPLCLAVEMCEYAFLFLNGTLISIVIVVEANIVRELYMKKAKHPKVLKKRKWKRKRERERERERNRRVWKEM